MANTVNVSDLITLSRQRANMEASQFVTDAEIVSLLDRGYKELYDLLVQTYQEYFLTSTLVTLVAGTDNYPLPADFYKLQGIDYITQNSTNSRWTMRPFMFNERNQYQSSAYLFSFSNTNLRYLISGSNLKFRPIPIQSGTIEVFYVPVPKTLTASSTPGPTEQNSIDAVNGYDEYVILDAAVNMLNKEESDSTALRAMKEETTQRIIKSAADRDIGQPQRVTDVSSQNWLFPFANFWAQ